VYLFARYYDLSIGRFYALDPELGSLSMPQTTNRYMYCTNNPLIYTDSTGRFLNFIVQVAVGAVVGAVVGAAKESRGDLAKIVEGALVGSAFGALTGAVGGATLGRLLGPYALPSGKVLGGINAAQTIGKSSGTYITGLKTAPFATKEGVAEGVELMTAQTAKDLGRCIGWGTAFSAQRTYNSALGTSMSEGAAYMIEQFQRARSYR